MRVSRGTSGAGAGAAIGVTAGVCETGRALCDAIESEDVQEGTSGMETRLVAVVEATGVGCWDVSLEEAREGAAALDSETVELPKATELEKVGGLVDGVAATPLESVATIIFDSVLFDNTVVIAEVLEAIDNADTVAGAVSFDGTAVVSPALAVLDRTGAVVGTVVTVPSKPVTMMATEAVPLDDTAVISPVPDAPDELDTIVSVVFEEARRIVSV